VECYLEHLNIVDGQESLLLMVSLGEKEGFLVEVRRALIALLLSLFHHSFQHRPCRTMESQERVETTSDVNKV
jgi:hypothetical protein